MNTLTAFLRTLPLRLTISRHRVQSYLRALERRDFPLAEALLGTAIPSQPILEATASDGTAALLRSLIFRGAQVRTAGGDSPPLLLLAYRSEVEGVEKFSALQAAGASVDGTIGPDRWTLLGFAAFFGNQELVRFLLSRGADARKADRNGLTPLLMAKIGGRLEIVDILLANGAEDAKPALRDIEPGFISGNSLHAQVHEAVKTALRFSKREVEKLEVRMQEAADSDTVLAYRISAGTGGMAHELHVRFLENGDFQAVLLDPASGSLQRDLLAALDGAKIGLRDLSTRIQFALESLVRDKTRQSQPASPLLPHPLRSACLILGVTPGSGAREILGAYRKLARQFHPDRHAGASPEELAIHSRKMAEINLAYEALKSGPSSLKD